MPLTNTFIAGKNVEHNQDSVTGVITQNPESTLSTKGGLGTTGTVADVAYGTPFVLLGRVGIDENSPAASTTYTVQWFNKDAPFKFRILEIVLKVVDVTAADFTDGDAGNLDFTVIRGDGDVSENESDVLADQTLDDDFENGETVRYPHGTVFLANDTVVEGGSLKAQLIVDPDATAGATNDGAMVDVEIHCLRMV